MLNPAVARFALKTVAYGKDIVALLIVAVPVVAPIVKVVASPPMDRLVAVVLKSVAVEFVVVMSPPFSARSPAVVMLPVVPTTSKLVRSMFPVVPVILFAPIDMALTISVSDRSIALVIAPPDDWMVIPDGSVSPVSRFSRRRSCEGGVGFAPSARVSLVYPDDPAKVLRVKLASFSVKAMLRPVDVVMVLPPL